jgi:hypothetical protein
MWSRSYRQHVIMAFPSFDTATNLWAAQADISWPSGPVRESEFVRFPTRVMSEAEAVSLALSRGKSWIDRRLQHMRVDRRSGRERILRRVVELQGSVTPASSKAVPRIHLARSKDPINIFTFGQFKAALLRDGAKVSEESLHKSYVALMKLAKNGCSWAEIKLKIKQSQDRLMAAKTSRRSVHSARLPLTERDWRRLV